MNAATQTEFRKPQVATTVSTTMDVTLTLPRAALSVAGVTRHIAGRDVVNQVSFDVADRSEERRVGKECRSRWSPYH